MINFAQNIFIRMTPRFHTLTIENIRKETEDTVSITFEIPSELEEDFSFQAGQYLTLKANIDGEELRRSYSLSSAPYENEWRVAIKKIDGGKFSTFANEKFSEGQFIEVMTPTGNFHLTSSVTNEKNYVLVAAGSGITPIISIVKTILKEEPKSKVTLFYGNKSVTSTIFNEEIETLKNSFSSNLKVISIFSRENTENPLQKGRINADKIEQLHKEFLQNSKIDEVFVCGPEEMVHCVKDHFSEHIADPKKIHFELFTTADIKKEVSTDTANKPSITSNVTVIIDGDSVELELKSDGETILDAASNAGGDLPFACKGGVCCTCKAKIIEGTASMDINYSLEPDDIAAGYILTCQAHPTSETLIISFDE